VGDRGSGPRARALRRQFLKPGGGRTVCMKQRSGGRDAIGVSQWEIGVSQWLELGGVGLLNRAVRPNHPHHPGKTYIEAARRPRPYFFKTKTTFSGRRPLF